MSWNTLEIPLKCGWQCTLVPAGEYRSPSGDSLQFIRDEDEREQLEQDAKDFDRYFQPCWDLRTITGGQTLSTIQSYASSYLNVAHWDLPTDNESIGHVLRAAVKDGRLVPVGHRDWRFAPARVYSPTPAPLRWPPLVNSSSMVQAVPYGGALSATVSAAPVLAGEGTIYDSAGDDDGGFGWLGVAETVAGAVLGGGAGTHDSSSHFGADLADGGKSTLLGDVQPFEYSEDAVSGSAFDVAKTPNLGDPGWYTNPGSGQMRLFGNDRRPIVDLDFDHIHNGLQPHAHNWGLGGRDAGNDVVPFSPWRP